MIKRADYTTILHVTDSHILASPTATVLGINTAHYFQEVIQHAFSAHHFDLILLTGDLAQDPCVASYQFIKDILEPYNTVCICLPGNHDDYDVMQQVFSSENITCRKHLLLDKWQLISLNSQIIGAEGGFLSNQELVFLEHCLMNNVNHYALIAAHHHCVETESSWMDTMIIKNREQLFSAIQGYPQVKAIAHGHIHQSGESNMAGVKIMGTPSTCYQFKPKAKEFSLDDALPGYRIISLYNNGDIKSEVIRLTEPLTGLQMYIHGY